MSGAFSAGGLITGLDSNSIIEQLMQIERQPITRLNTRIEALGTQKTAVKDLRSQLLTLRNLFQDFRFGSVFTQYNAASSEADAMTVSVSGANPVIGSYQVEVIGLASATVATSSGTLGAPIDPDATLDSSGIAAEISAGTFSVNGVTFNVDPETQSLNDILSTITADPNAGVNATYDSVTDKVTFSNKTAGDTSIIIFGGGDDTSSFLQTLGVTEATQSNGPTGETQVTSTYNLGAVDISKPLNEVRFAGGAITGTYFKVNGVTITYDPATEGISDVLARLNSSDANVTASYDSATDTIRVVSNKLGSRTIKFTEGDGNFLTLTNLTAAAQVAGNDAQFKINGGAVQTRSTNEVSDAIGGLTLNFLSVGTSTVTVSSNDDAIVEKVQELLTTFNESVDKIRGLVGIEGDLAGDGTIRAIENTLRSTVFNLVEGLGNCKSLPEIGITTGDSFDAEASAHLQLDEDTFREALRDDRVNVEALFSNANNTGIADQLFNYLDEATKATGFLNARVKSNGSIDTQISQLNDQIARLEDRVSQKETLLRKQFSQLEQMAAVYQQQGIALNSLSSQYLSI
jgi:flagellar hook-associated protein 2